MGALIALDSLSSSKLAPGASMSAVSPSHRPLSGVGSFLPPLGIGPPGFSGLAVYGRSRSWLLCCPGSAGQPIPRFGGPLSSRQRVLMFWQAGRGGGVVKAAMGTAVARGPGIWALWSGCPSGGLGPRAIGGAMNHLLVAWPIVPKHLAMVYPGSTKHCLNAGQGEGGRGEAGRGLRAAGRLYMVSRLSALCAH